MSAAADDKRVIDILNKSFERGRNPSVKLLGGRIVSYDRAKSTLAMDFEVMPTMDNGNRQVMGGFLAAMMDVTVAQAVVVHSGISQTVSTLEQKTSLLAPVRLSKSPVEGSSPPRLRCEATAIKRGRTVAFYEVSLMNNNDELIARATQTTLLVDIPKRDAAKPASAKL